MAGAAELADGHLFDQDDVFRATQALPRNMSAALVLIEHLWAKPMLDAVDRAGGIELYERLDPARRSRLHRAPGCAARHPELTTATPNA